MIFLHGWQRINCALLLGMAFLSAACRRYEYVSLKPLDEAGFSFSTELKIQELEPTKEEVAQLTAAAKGGLSESACVDLLRIARGQKRRFAEGEAVAALHAANLADPTILELVRLQQIPSWSGEAQAIRLTGTSDRVILAVAQRRAAGQPILAGTSLAHLKDAGISEATVIELVNRGISDTDAESIAWRKKRGWKDEQILHDFPPKS